MELRQLEYLVAVADEANFTRAAERLHVAQPGVSAQIRRLERELGCILFDRSTRIVRPTEAGAVVLAHARAALAAVRQVRSAIDDLAGLLRGHVSVGTVTAGGPINLPDRLADFHLEHPGVEITLTEDSSQRLAETVTTGRLDLALIGIADATPPGLAIEIIADQPLVAIVPNDHPLAARRRIRLKNLAGEPLMTLPGGSGIRTALDAGFASTGLQPRIAFEASDPRVLIGLAARSLGIAVLPAAESDCGRTDRIREIQISHPQMRARLALAWRADETTAPATTALVRHLVHSNPARRSGNARQAGVRL